ncbi:MAG: YlxM family DNA-binding protein [Firmicutes bacterium]|nr:YlxM family DNA-binding protein [Bacillota bacterium]
MKIEDITRTSLLCDFYGELLTERQRQITELYVQENFTLGEIAGELGISRQAVHDALRSGQRSLEGYEEKLGLVQRFLQTQQAIEVIDRKIQRLIERAGADGIDAGELTAELKEIRAIIDRLEE